MIVGLSDDCEDIVDVESRLIWCWRVGVRLGGDGEEKQQGASDGDREEDKVGSGLTTRDGR